MKATATIINRLTGERIKVHATYDHPDCSYGKAVWVDDNNNAYLQVKTNAPNPFYDVVIDEPFRTRIRIGQRLTQLRKDSGMSLRDLSAATGVNKADISKYENGKTSPTIDMLSRFGKVLGFEVNIFPQQS